MRQSHKAIERIKHIASLPRDKAIAFLKSERITQQNTLMKTEHTPGPWYYRPDGICVEAQSAEGYNLCVAKCEVSYSAAIDETAAKANAKLIASAPSLLAENARIREALEDLAYVVEHEMPDLCDPNDSPCEINGEESLCYHKCREYGCIKLKIIEARLALAESVGAK